MFREPRLGGHVGLVLLAEARQAVEERGAVAARRASTRRAWRRRGGRGVATRPSSGGASATSRPGVGKADPPGAGRPRSRPCRCSRRRRSARCRRARGCRARRMPRIGGVALGPLAHEGGQAGDEAVLGVLRPRAPGSTSGRRWWTDRRGRRLKVPLALGCDKGRRASPAGSAGDRGRLGRTPPAGEIAGASGSAPGGRRVADRRELGVRALAPLAVLASRPRRRPVS